MFATIFYVNKYVYIDHQMLFFDITMGQAYRVWSNPTPYKQMCEEWRLTLCA